MKDGNIAVQEDAEIQTCILALLVQPILQIFQANISWEILPTKILYAFIGS
jgi:hypothetical protein